MKMSDRRAIIVMLVLLIVLADISGFVHAQPLVTVPLDGRIQELVSGGVLMGAPSGDLQLERTIQGGEFITMIERVLRMPASSAQRFSTGTAGTQSDRWVRVYAWSRTVWNRALAIGTSIRQLWFRLRYRRAENQPWGLARTHWMSAGLRDAYLESGLINLTFKPMEALNGSDAIDLILAAAGYGGEVTAVREQMPEATPDEARRMVCYQHDMERLMQYAGKPLTRKDAALMVWLLMARRVGTT
jgi:hypothetical protein